MNTYKIASTNKMHLLCLAILIVLGSCTKVDRNDDVKAGDPPPVPGGFTNSSQVATTNLLAYWNFDANSNEVKTNTAPSNAVNTTSSTGIKGKGLTFNQGFVVYPTIPALSTANAVGSCTVSLWLKFANNGSKLTSFFALSRDVNVETSWLTILNVASETGNHPVSDDYLYFHSWIGSYANGNRSGGDNINDYGNAGQDYQRFQGANKWVQYIMRYDGATSTIDLFANNIRVSNNNFRVRGTLGALVATIPTRVVLGGFPNTSTGFTNSPTEGFHGLYTGSMDEVRVYNKALSDLEINALYQVEKQGR